jgi:hypothetical protein
MNEVEKVGKYGTWGKNLLKFETMNELGKLGYHWSRIHKKINIDIAWN